MMIIKEKEHSCGVLRIALVGQWRYHGNHVQRRQERWPSSRISCIELETKNALLRSLIIQNRGYDAVNSLQRALPPGKMSEKSAIL